MSKAPELEREQLLIDVMVRVAVGEEPRRVWTEHRDSDGLLLWSDLWLEGGVFFARVRSSSPGGVENFEVSLGAWLLPLQLNGEGVRLSSLRLARLVVETLVTSSPVNQEVG